jgi:SlyX protein
MADGQPPQDPRIDDLEARLTFQDDAISTLSDALIEQLHQINRLEKTLDRLIELLKERGSDDPGPAEEPPPPHY